MKDETKFLIEKATRTFSKTEDLPDGIYFIAKDRTNYQLMTDNDTTPHFPTKYIGVKLGQRAIAATLQR